MEVVGVEFVATVSEGNDVIDFGGELDSAGSADRFGREDSGTNVAPSPMTGRRLALACWSFGPSTGAAVGAGAGDYSPALVAESSA